MTLVQEINALLLKNNATGVSAQEIWEVVTDHEDRERRLLALAGTDRAAVDLMLQREMCVNLGKTCAELRAALRRAAKERKDLIDGICTANNALGEFIDKYYDEDPPEGSMGSPPRATLRDLQAHLDGTCIGRNGDYMDREEFADLLRP